MVILAGADLLIHDASYTAAESDKVAGGSRGVVWVAAAPGAAPIASCSSTTTRCATTRRSIGVAAARRQRGRASTSLPPPGQGLDVVRPAWCPVPRARRRSRRRLPRRERCSPVGAGGLDPARCASRSRGPALRRPDRGLFRGRPPSWPARADPAVAVCRAPPRRRDASRCAVAARPGVAAMRRGWATSPSLSWSACEATLTARRSHAGVTDGFVSRSPPSTRAPWSGRGLPQRAGIAPLTATRIACARDDAGVLAPLEERFAGSRGWRAGLRRAIAL